MAANSCFNAVFRNALSYERRFDPSVNEYVFYFSFHFYGIILLKKVALCLLYLDLKSPYSPEQYPYSGKAYISYC